MGISTPFFVTHVRIIASGRSTGARAPGFGPVHYALLPLRREGGAREFGIALTPDHFRRGVSRVVSCYALFKWWLPLSQHPTCPRDFTALVTQRMFGALFGGPGLFPFRQRSLAPAVSLPGMQSTRSSEFDGLRHPGRGPRSISALHPREVLPDAAPKGISERTSYHPA